MEGEKKEACAALLRAKYGELRAAGIERYPSRGDFSAEEVQAIKAQLGPWPRALELAGIKPPPTVTPAERNRQRRIRAKRRRREGNE